MNPKFTEPPDLAKLAQFTGTAQYWRVARQFVITDGVKYLAESAACFWLIDAAISHLLEIGTADWFVLVRVEVSGSSAVMIYEDGNGSEHARQEIAYTDLPLFEVIEVKAKSYSGDVSERVKSIGGQLRLYTNVPRGAGVEMSFDVWD